MQSGGDNEDLHLDSNAVDQNNKEILIMIVMRLMMMMMMTMMMMMSMMLIQVNTETVAVMGATLANGGICPTTGQKVGKDDNDAMVMLVITIIMMMMATV